MIDNQKPLDFLNSLKEERLFQEFANYVVVNLCDDFNGKYCGAFIEVPDPVTGQSNMYVEPFTAIMEREITKVKEQLLSEIATEIVQKEDLKYKAAIVDHYLTSISYLASSLDGKKHLVNYPFVKEIIDGLKTTLEDKYRHQTISNSCTSSKFQWAGKTNVLVTLFYDLVTGQDHKAPLLTAKKDEVKKFLKEHFVDADGNLLSEATINTIFTPSKGDKRAKIGDRIELP